MTGDNMISTLVWGFLLIVGYGALLRGFAVLAQPSRMRLAELGAHLVESKEIDADTKKEIEFEISHNFSAVISWLTAILVLPALGLLVWRKANGLPVDPKAGPDQVWEFRHLALITSLSNSPLALGLFSVQLALVGVFFRSATIVSQLLRLVEATADRAPNVRRFAS